MKSMRRANRQMTHAEALELLGRGEYGVLSTIDSDDQPYGTPLNYVLFKGAIYFHCALEGTKLDNIRMNPSVCFTVVGRTHVEPAQFATIYESVVAFGLGVVVEDEKDKREALQALVRKYSPGFEKEGEAVIAKAMGQTAVVRIDISEITGKHRLSE